MKLYLASLAAGLLVGVILAVVEDQLQEVASAM